MVYSNGTMWANAGWCQTVHKTDHWYAVTVREHSQPVHAGPSVPYCDQVLTESFLESSASSHDLWQCCELQVRLDRNEPWLNAGDPLWSYWHTHAHAVFAWVSKHTCWAPSAEHLGSFKVTHCKWRSFDHVHVIICTAMPSADRAPSLAEIVSRDLQLQHKLLWISSKTVSPLC